ncbi:protein kinase domain-containing protein [Yinghuangia seranimata]|uniref:protein kinase domain-containing protein n=1 Tax=Yinghuangia seranimata TaxID=408067 RepID=UPI00248CFBC5|nr:protein kinase [Yinghuangia seranimata]MDI2130970.1 DUF1349 domain-containing protein [Yinghuangia seranimata]
MEALRAEDPSVVAGYRMLARLGAGGMGRVYLARSPGGRPVAFKVIRADFADDPDFRVRFAREVAAARAVSGVFTAPVLDADPQGDPPWLATGYVAGVALNDAVARFGPLPDALGTLAGGLAEALVAVHGAGLVHRDLKPGNVMLAADGPRLIDFGIARALEGGTITGTGLLVGSPGFLAPEQAGTGPIGPATDVFALGSVLTYAATGRGPFGEGALTELLFKVLHGDPDLSGVPPRFAGLVRDMLEKDPGLRPSPRDVLERLAGFPDATRSGAWLPRPLTELVLARSAALLSDDPLGADFEVRGDAPPTTSSGGRPVPERRVQPPPPSGSFTLGSTTIGPGGAYRGHTGDTPPTGPGSVPPTVPPDEPDRRDRAHDDGARWRRIIGAAVAVAVLATAAILVVPRLTDGGSDGNHASGSGASSPGTPSAASPSPSPTACGATSLDFTTVNASTSPLSGFTGVTASAPPKYGPQGLTLTAPPGSDVRTDFQGKVTAVSAGVPVTGDFTVETRVTVNPNTGYQAAGLLLYVDGSNYVRLERGLGDHNAIAFEYYAQDQHHKLTTPFITEPEPKLPVDSSVHTVSLRLERKGGFVSAQWRADDAKPWENVTDEKASLAGNEASARMSVLNTPTGTGAKNFSATFRSLRVTCPTG